MKPLDSIQCETLLLRSSGISREIDKRLTELEENSGGLSYNLRTQEFLDPSHQAEEIYIISLFDAEEVFDHRPNYADIFHWLRKNLWAISEHVFVGVWHHEASWYLDLSARFQGGLSDALKVAHQLEQIAVYSPSMGRAISVNGLNQSAQ